MEWLNPNINPMASLIWMMMFFCVFVLIVLLSGIFFDYFSKIDLKALDKKLSDLIDGELPEWWLE